MKNVMSDASEENLMVERRQDQRYLFACELTGTELPSLAAEAELIVFRGQVQNISSGGMCFLTDQAVQVSHLIRCEVRIDAVPTAIRLLMQVRWCRSLPGGAGYAVGTSFLI
jgi:hypothetical protein